MENTMTEFEESVSFDIDDPDFAPSNSRAIAHNVLRGVQFADIAFGINKFFQSKNAKKALGDLPYYREIKKYLILIGQYPQQTDRRRFVIYTIEMIGLITILIPASLQFITTLSDNDIDGALESLPIFVTNIVTIIKMGSLYINREQIKELYDLVVEEWESTKNNEISISNLNEVTRRGNLIVQLYRRTLLSFMVVFVLLPLVPIILDVLQPLNETRSRQQLFKLNYLVDVDVYFFPIYFHTTCISIISVIIIITNDSILMLITHHACGLFFMCGHRTKRAAERNNFADEKDMYEEFRNCADDHNKAIQFYHHLNGMNQTSFLLQIGMNMMAISVTAVQTVMNLDEPKEALRISVFLIAQQFHLFFMSVPGQRLVEYSLGVAEILYSSNWYRVPVRIQNVVYTMLIRSGVPCIMTAGGLYNMNIENFGVIFKTCVSYFTMLMSMRE